MDRRAYLEKMATLLGVTLSGPAIAVLLQGCEQEEEVSVDTLFFDRNTLSLVRSLADKLLPTTDTPGALEVGVDQTLDRLLAFSLDSNDQVILKSSLFAFQDFAAQQMGKPFDKGTTDEQATLLQQIETLDPSSLDQEASPAAFYWGIKPWILLAYFTSEPIMKEYLDYHPVPGRYEACIPYAGQAVYVDNNVAG